MTENGPNRWWLVGLLVPGIALAHDEPHERFIIDAAVKLLVEPEYPKDALAAGTEGEATVAFLIDVFGRTDQAEVVNSTPKGVFDAEVLATIRHWRFEPAREPNECRRLEQRATQTFRFRASAPEPERIQVLPTVVEGIPSPERPVIRARTEAEMRDALSRAYPSATLPKVDIKPLKRVEPSWPRKALVEGIQGGVTAKFRITEQGAVEDVQITESFPKFMFDSAVIRALKRWRFEPPMKDGKPTAWSACQTIQFDLIDP